MNANEKNKEKETHSFQTTETANIINDKSTTIESDNIKRPRSGLVNKVMDTT